MISKNILVVNSGSTGVKYTVFNNKKEIIFSDTFGLKEKKKELSFLNKDLNIGKIGFRVVHGLSCSKTSLINKNVLKEIKSALKFAPIHNKILLEKYKLINSIFSNVKKYAVFDTAFHSTISKEVSLLPLPIKLASKNKLKKYGFHGIANISVIKQVDKYKGQNIIIAHLGGGCSISAVKNAKSLYNSMDFTPNSGIMAKTRSGSTDSGLFDIVKDKNLSNKLSFNSGFLGLTGSVDTKKIIEKAKKDKNKKSKEYFAYNLFLNQIVKEILYSYYILNFKLDCLVLSGGIGFNNKYIKNDLCSKLKVLNLPKDKFIKIKSFEAEEIYDSIN